MYPIIPKFNDQKTFHAALEALSSYSRVRTPVSPIYRASQFKATWFTGEFNSVHMGTTSL